jgi:molecular chaperone Hsp33
MKDFLYRGLIKDLNVRFAYALTTDVATTAIKSHDCGPLVGHLLSRSLAAGVLCAPTLGDDERASITWEYPGPIKKVVVEFGNGADIRGTSAVKQLMGQVEEEADIYGDTGSVKVLKSSSKQVTGSGTCEGALMDVVSDLCYYFSVSEQLETDMYIAVGFNQDPENPVNLCQGVFLQAMPDCDFEAFEKMRQVLHSPEFKKLIAVKPENDNYFEILLNNLLKNEDVKPEYEIHACNTPEFKCNCSRQKTKAVLTTLNEGDVKDIVAKGNDIKVSCHFCSKTYAFSPEEVKSAKS